MAIFNTKLDNLFIDGNFSLHLDAAAEWLLKSVRACSVKGSSAFYSRLYHPIRGWSYPYPETTGYIIPTFIKYGQQYDKPEFIDLALDMAEWIMSLQRQDGALPGGDHRGKINEPSVFNTGQMVLGLISAFQLTKDDDFLSAASNSVHWLANAQNEDGSWTRYAYQYGFSPSYYTRVTWPMLAVCDIIGKGTVYNKAVKALDFIVNRHNGKSIRDWGFKPGHAAFTHTIAYTIRGLLESALLLPDGKKYWAMAKRIAIAVFRQFEIKGKLAGRFSEDLKGDYWFTCLTGNCQLAICWLILYENTGDARLLNAAIKAVAFVASKQKLHTWDANLRGAIPGSAPIWGRYLIFRYPNWAAKFYMDAMMKIADELCSLKGY